MKIRFAEFRLDEERYVLERNGDPVALRPKVFDLLAYLVRHRRRVVLREELIEHVWRTTAVGTGSLSGLVNELRQALGERAQGESSIRTVHARGYQFVASVVEEDGRREGSARAVFDEPASHAPLASRIDVLVARVSSEGPQGVMVEHPGWAACEERGAWTRRAGGGALGGLLDRVEAAGFEVQHLPASEPSSRAGSGLPARLMASMVASRGEGAVRSAVPVTAQRRISTVSTAGDPNAPCTWLDAHPVGLSAVASTLAALARRRPVSMVFSDAVPVGASAARELLTLCERLEGAPVLWVIPFASFEAAGDGFRVLEGGGFSRWPAVSGARTLFSEWLCRSASEPLPPEIEDLLLRQMASDPRPAGELLEDLLSTLRQSSRTRRLLGAEPPSRNRRLHVAE